jgi:hypothetical protein
MPPNAGWFATTDGINEQSSQIRTAQNDEHLSDAPLDFGGNRAVLPPGQRNDEFADLLEWIANAQPKDKQPIRAEIKRHFYDVGDESSGDALNAALDNVLGPGIEHKDRQKILDAIGPYSRSEEDDREFLIGVGLLSLAMVPPISTVETVSAAWELGWADRGFYFSEQLGANLPRTFPVIDIWQDGVATSIKSIDLRAATYQDAARLTSRLNSYLSKLADFAGGSMGDWTISSSAIEGRTLSLAVPKGSVTAIQRSAISAARTRARTLGIDLTITEF